MPGSMVQGGNVAEVNPPSWEAGASHQAYQDRMTISALMTPHYSAGPFIPRPGVRPSAGGTGLLVTQDTTPDMFVLAGAGTVWVPGSILSNAGWVCHNDAAKRVPITPASLSHPRIDLIIAHVYDAVDDSGSLNQWALEAVAGTPAASPVAPAAPTNSLVLAQVSVGTGATSITNANITDKRTYSVALGGVLPVLSSAKPVSPYTGQVVYCTDTGVTLVWNGSTWAAVGTGLGPWSSNQVSSPPWNVTGTWVDFTGAAWPPVTFTVPPSGKVYVTVTGSPSNSAVTTYSYMSWRISGADTVGSDYPQAILFGSNGGGRGANRRLVTGLTPGATDTATPTWRYNSGTANDAGGGQLIVEAVP